MNKVMLIGNLGADPELRHTGSGTAVCNLRIATNETRKVSDTEKKTVTEWHSVVVWGGRAEAVAKNLRKGSPVAVEGKLRTRSFEQDVGDQKVKQYRTEIHADSVSFLPDPNRTQRAAEPILDEGGDDAPVQEEIPF